MYDRCHPKAMVPEKSSLSPSPTRRTLPPSVPTRGYSLAIIQYVLAHTLSTRNGKAGTPNTMAPLNRKNFSCDIKLHPVKFLYSCVSNRLERLKFFCVCVRLDRSGNFAGERSCSSDRALYICRDRFSKLQLAFCFFA
jgi:hypothetical protein